MNFDFGILDAYHSDLYMCSIKMLLEITLFKLTNNLFIEKFKWERITFVYIVNQFLPTILFVKYRKKNRFGFVTFVYFY